MKLINEFDAWIDKGHAWFPTVSLKLSLINNEMEKWKFTISKKWGENVQTFISNAFKFLGLWLI